MSVSFRVEGFRDMERALADLKRATAKAAVRRAMKKTLQPVALMADSLSEDFNIAVGTTLTPKERRQAKADFSKRVVSMFVGPVGQDGSHAPEATFTEFGTPPRYHKDGKYVGQIMAEPFMRPAWDAHKATMIKRLGAEIWVEIEKSIARAERKAARAAAAMR